MSGGPSFDVLDFAREVVRRTGGETRSRRAELAAANAAFVVDEEVLDRRLREPEREMWLRVWQSVVLARDVATFEALLDGESVPLSRLDPEWVERFGRHS